MKNLRNKKILLIICGGIAAYKSLELIRILKKSGSIIKVVLTKNSQKFVTPLSVTSLSQEKVYTDLFDYKEEAEMGHISLSRWSDLILIAPATANFLSKIRYGLANDLASAIVLASDKSIFIAPAMNVRMWEHSSTQENIKKLKEFNYKFIGPEKGDMACGEYGDGKLTEPQGIINIIENYFSNINKNKKFKALVTAGPTREYIDPIRYLTNESSGKQGYEIAKSLKKNGFETTLISGPTELEDIDGVKTIRVKSAQEMFNETIKNLPADVSIFTAAVSDFKLKEFKTQKIKKSKFRSLDVEENIDILDHVSKNNLNRPRLVIGFSAETDKLKENSLKKLNSKNCDWIVANDVSKKGIGFNSDENEVTIFYKNLKEDFIPQSKKIFYCR